MYLVFFLLVCMLALLGGLLVLSPGKPKPFLDSNGAPLAGSISIKTLVNINGVEQGMFIKGQNVNNPVLLYLHGGIPDHFLNEDYPSGLDEYFTVVWWEQRGSGMSYSAKLRPETVNLEQLVSDTLALTNHLRQRFGQEKIYLMGRSGGTLIGIQAAARAPQAYTAYIAVAQITNQLKSEKLAYDYMLASFKDEGDAKMVRKLEQAPVTDTLPLPQAYLSVRDVAMHRLGIGTIKSMKSIFTGLFLRSLLNREYTLGEKISLWRGKIFSGKQLWNAQLATDVPTKVPQLQIPVYFLHGIFDYTVSYPLAKAYFQQLDAPIKGFYSFEQSAHSPIFEEPQKVGQIMRLDVMRGKTQLADPP